LIKIRIKIFLLNYYSIQFQTIIKKKKKIGDNDKYRVFQEEYLINCMSANIVNFIFLLLVETQNQKKKKKKKKKKIIFLK